MKDGDKWVPVDELNAYIVLGNMLGTYWLKDGMETLKWWEFTIDGDTMNMTALSEDEEVKAATFEMKRIEE